HRFWLGRLETAQAPSGCAGAQPVRRGRPDPARRLGRRTATGARQGKNLDWFASSQIIALSVVAVVGFVAFLIWELHEKHPVVDLRVFRHRGFNASVITVSVAYAAFFGVSVLTPLWLQSFMGYTATDAGLATAWTGVTALLVAPLV